MERAPEKRLPRRSVMASAAFGVIGAAGTGLAGCTGGSEEEAPWTALATTPQPVSLSRVDLDDLRPEPAVKTPDGSYAVAGAKLSPSFTREELEQLFYASSAPHDGVATEAVVTSTDEQQQ